MKWMRLRIATTLAKARAGILWVQRHINALSPPVLFTGYLFYGAVMLVVTAACNLATIPIGEERIKGYFWELNWGVNHLVIIPVALFCSALVLRQVQIQLPRIAAAHMVVDGHYNPLPESTLREDWNRYQIGPFWFTTILLLAFSASWWEWFDGSYFPITHSNTSQPLGGRDNPGWTAGALYNPTGIPRLPNLVMSFIAFTAQGFVTTLFCYVFGTVLAFSMWIYSYSGVEDRKLVPNVSSLDIRRGFEEFEPLVFHLLWLGVAFTFVFFFIRIQSVYDYSDSHAKTVFGFILEDVVKGFFGNILAIFKGEQLTLFDVGKAHNYSTIIACAGMLAMIAVVVIIPTLILDLLARQSQDSMRECLSMENCPPCTERRLSKTTCKRRTVDMDFWPLRYPRPMELLAYVIFAAFCFFFYKFTLLLFGLLVMRMVRVVYKGLTTPPVLSAPNGEV
jgi:hypothetical protein